MSNEQQGKRLPEELSDSKINESSVFFSKEDLLLLTFAFVSDEWSNKVLEA